MNGLLDVEFDISLTGNSELLDRVATHNAIQNERKVGTPDETYLLPQVRNTSGSFGHADRVDGHGL